MQKTLYNILGGEQVPPLPMRAGTRAVKQKETVVKL